MSVKLRLSLSLVLLTLVIIVVGLTGLFALNMASEKTRSIVVDRVQPLQQLKLVADAYAVKIVDTTHKVLMQSLTFDQGSSELAEALGVIDTEWSAFSATAMDPEEQALADQTSKAMIAATPSMQTLDTLFADGDLAGLENYRRTVLYQLIDPISDSISALVDIQTRVAMSEYNAAIDTRNMSFVVMGGLGIASLLVVLYAMNVILRGVTKPLVRMKDAMQQFAQGDFSQDVPYRSLNDEIGDMAGALAVFRENGIRVQTMNEQEAGRSLQAAKRAETMMRFQSAFSTVVEAASAGDFSQRIKDRFDDQDLDRVSANFNAMVETVDAGLGEAGIVLASLAKTNLTTRMEGTYQGAFAALRDDINAVGDQLTHIVAQLRKTSRGVRSATSEILAGANDLSERTTKQAATIEETSAAMERLATTVVATADKAQAASVKAQDVSRTAEEGGAVMRQATGAMAKITTSSDKICNIIGLIDDIAFQTNLLALNASVEAARAGEAGKGFAVVAVEVRRLAQSAASASADVKVLVDQSATEVAGGSRLVAEAAAKLEAILGGIRENSDVMAAIANDSKEQASSIEEVNIAVRQMDEMTQHNAALVEETNAAIEQTEGQASELDRIVDTFVLEDTSPSTLATDNVKSPAKRHSGPYDLPNKIKQVAKAYISHGNAALAQDWNEF